MPSNLLVLLQSLLSDWDARRITFLACGRFAFEKKRPGLESGDFAGGEAIMIPLAPRERYRLDGTNPLPAAGETFLVSQPRANVLISRQLLLARAMPFRCAQRLLDG